MQLEAQGTQQEGLGSQAGEAVCQTWSTILSLLMSVHLLCLKLLPTQTPLAA